LTPTPEDPGHGRSPFGVAEIVSAVGYCFSPMGEVSTRPVETGEALNPSTAVVPASARAPKRWPSTGTHGWRYALLRRFLACADVVAAFLASLSLAVVGDGDASQFAWSLVFLPLWIVAAKLLGLYDRDQRKLRHLTVDEAPQIVMWALIGTAGLSLFLGLTPAGPPDAYGAVVAGVVAGISVIVFRSVARWAWRRLMPAERVAVIASIGASALLRRKLELFPDVHATIVAVHDPADIDHIGRHPSALATVERLFYAPASLDEQEVRAVLDIARAAGVELSVIPPCTTIFGTAVQLNHLAELPILDYRTGDLSRSTLFLKRILDVAVSALALTVLSPLLMLIAIAIKLDSRGPVLFVQHRAGLGGRSFRMNKFRSMVLDAEARLPGLVSFDSLDEPMFKLRDDPRVTRVGRLLRRSSLDELPQLWNVLTGDMSLVGPRPEQLELVDKYSPEERFRLSVKPGLTGPMQVYGRGQLTFAERLAVERDYFENLSLGRDLRILGMTLAVVLGRRGAY
jgi:exopolysaccharide biosynthesis polyprenyl glycosylphosphotransferase